MGEGISFVSGLALSSECDLHPNWVTTHRGPPHLQGVGGDSGPIEGSLLLHVVRVNVETAGLDDGGSAAGCQ
jgi:hypothetical protein